MSNKTVPSVEKRLELVSLIGFRREGIRTNVVQRSLVRPPSSKLLSKARMTDYEVRALVELITPGVCID